MLLILLASAYFEMLENLELLLAIIAVYLIIALTIAIYLKVINDHIFYIATERELIRREGIIKKKRTITSFAKISNVSVGRGILDRVFNLGTLYIDTMGGKESYEITMDNLQMKDMEEFIDIIKDMMARREDYKPAVPQKEAEQPRREEQFEVQTEKKPPQFKEFEPARPHHMNGVGYSGKERLAELEYKAYVRQEDEKKEKQKSKEGEEEPPPEKQKKKKQGKKKRKKR